MSSRSSIGTSLSTSALSSSGSVDLSSTLSILSSPVGSADRSSAAPSSTVSVASGVSSSETSIPSPSGSSVSIAVPSTSIGSSSLLVSTAISAPDLSSSGRSSSLVLPIAVPSETLPDQVVSSSASSRASVSPQSAARATSVSPKTSSVEIVDTVIMSDTQMSTETSTRAPAQGASETSTHVSTSPATVTKTEAAGGPSPAPSASESSQSTTAPVLPTTASSSSRPSSISSIATTAASTASASQSLSTGPARPADPDTPSSTGRPSSTNSVQGANVKTPTATSTITDVPETTLSTPVFVTVTDGNNHQSLSEPPIFTSIGVSTMGDGSLVSITHVIANPTGIWGVSQASSSSGFFSNSKAVAGVFLAVGLIIAGGIGAVVCLLLRRRKRRTPRFLNNISRPLPLPDNPFEDPRSLSPPPQMRYASGYTDRTLIIGGAANEANRPTRSPFDEDTEPASTQGSVSHHSHEPINGLGLAGIGANGRRASVSGHRASVESRRRNPSGNSSIGIALTSDMRIDASRSHRPVPSSVSTRSSPSLYPPSLPVLNGEDNQSLVDIPLSTNNSTTRVGAHPSSPTAADRANRVSSPTTRKPVPVHSDTAEPRTPTTPTMITPLSPAPRSPQQIQAQQTKPPVLPPRSPLRRNSSRSPPPVLASIQTQLRKPEEAATQQLQSQSQFQLYAPLTPPASLSSSSPVGSQSGHEPPSPASTFGNNGVNGKAPNPFSDAYATTAQSQFSGSPTSTASASAGKRDTFYSRVGGQQRRPSVEWKA